MKKYKKYKDNPEYEFVPYSNNPQYAMGGTNDTDPQPKKSYTPIPLSLTANWEPSSVDSAIAFNYGLRNDARRTDPRVQNQQDWWDLNNADPDYGRVGKSNIKEVGNWAELSSQPYITAPNGSLLAESNYQKPVGVPKKPVTDKFQIRETNFGAPIIEQWDPNTKQYRQVLGIPKGTKPENITTIPWKNEMKPKKLAMGGMYQGQPNAEIEGGGNGTAGEVVNYPDGTTDQAFGETHEKGGVEVNLPEATRIFSNRIKIGKRTIAKIAQRYKTNKEEAILKDTTSSSLQKKTAELNMSTKNKKLDEIFNMQEIMKSKRINSYIKRYGGTQMYAEGGQANYNAADYDAYASGANMVVNAGMATNDAIQLNDTSNKDYRKEDNKDLSGQIGAAGMGAASGAVTGASIGSAVPVIGTAIGAVVGGAIGGTSAFFKKRSTDKKEWKAEQEAENQQMITQQNAAMYAQPQLQQPQLMPQQYSQQPRFYGKNGGMMKMYSPGGTHNSYVSDPPTLKEWESNINPYYTLDPYNNYVDNPNKRENFVGGSPSIGNVSNPYAGDPNGAGNPMNKKGFIPPNINPATDQDVEDYNNRNKSNFYSKNKEMLGQAGTEIGLGLLNNAGNLAYLAQNGRDYDKVDYGSVTPELPTDRDSQREIREAYSTGVYNLKNSGRLTQAGLVGLTGEKMKAAAGSRERIGNTIADIRNRTNMFNKQTKIRGMENEAENKGVAESNYYTAFNSIGQNIASQRGDYLSGQMDQKKLKLIQDYFPNYEFNPETWQYMYKSALQQSKIKK